jgi:spore coat polysaccharide biosynthesis protein SpsF
MRVLGVIQSRFSSSRLPGKGLMDVAGRPLLEWVILRMQRSRRLDSLVLATTTRSDDDAVAATGARLGLPVVRGELDDVLARYIRALDAHPADVAVRITADNPLTDPEWMDRQIAWFEAGGYDYSQLKDCPYGSGTDTFRASGLRLALAETADPLHHEHINQFFLAHPDRFRLGDMPLPRDLSRPDVRVTVDTPADLESIRRLFGRLADPLAAGLPEMIAAWDSLPP